jgi:hypothetical protein
MSDRRFDRANDPAPHYPARKVRGGEIILGSRIERLIFIAGLAGAVLLLGFFLFGAR